MTLEEGNEQIVLMVGRGAEIKEAAIRFGLSYGMTWLICMRAGIRKRRAAKKDETRRWLRHVESGLSIAAAARLEGVPEMTLRARVNNFRGRIANG